MSYQGIKQALTLRNWLTVMSLLVLFIGATACYACDVDVEIQISPHVLNLAKPGDCLTVHTDISYSDVAGETVSLNGVAIQSWKSDNRGNFVAKFNMADIVNLPLEIGAYNRFELAGETNSGEAFCGAEEIMVIDNASKAR
ncbi:hypothetical protein ACFL0G_05245 [Candidatus Zixiibacteriota bacterium]